MRRDKNRTVVEQLQPIMEVKSYKSLSKQQQFLMKNGACMKKQIQETMK